ncbi:hypothetical protein DTO164E3_5814 [Paecilomyces variotii]|nr:hypothetical protein DTO164E3_5814 [Paecilomyces variotii]KAJ9263672.1 hypothetical protein DTO212C5_7457 [Paecilomyces variotii]
MTAVINCYVDCVSPYSFVAVVHLLRNRDVLASHDVKIELHPIFLGGVMQGSGNKPPWKLPAKARYGVYERQQATKYFGLPDFEAPSFFPILSLLPQRAITYIKASYSAEKYEKTLLLLWDYLFYQHQDISQPDVLARLLTDDAKFTPSETETILAATGEKKWKDALLAKTQEALDHGAFGAPWFQVINKKGEESMFFGSDRFHYMWQHLELPFQDLKILPKGQSDSKL